MKTSKSYTHKVFKAIHSINKELKESETAEQDAEIITKTCSQYGLNEKSIRTIGKFKIN